jgi:hypothetical protein
MNAIGVDYRKWNVVERMVAGVSVVAELYDVLEDRDIFTNEKSLFRIPHLRPVAWKHSVELHKAASTGRRILDTIITSRGPDADAT